MPKHHRNYLPIAAAICLTSLPFGSSLTRATLAPTTRIQDSGIQLSTWTTQAHPPQLIARSQRTYSLQLLSLINAERQKVGAPPLRTNLQLTQAALGQSQDMATNNFFSHTGSNGSEFSDRISTTGYDWSAVAENIAAGQSTPTAVVRSWLNSPPHKQNMLNPQYTEVGFGYAYNSQSSNKTYWTAEFAKPF
ncbi:MAG TPA: CAP domain-containing protein [Chroococcales cyanobacterium]